MDLDKTGFKSCLNICSFLDNVKHQYDGVFFVGERGSGDGNLDLPRAIRPSHHLPGRALRSFAIDSRYLSLYTP